eukprot:6857511-Pyramimonas_sp.AAC.1
MASSSIAMANTTSAESGRRLAAGIKLRQPFSACRDWGGPWPPARPRRESAQAMAASAFAPR